MVFLSFKSSINANIGIPIPQTTIDGTPTPIAQKKC